MNGQRRDAARPSHPTLQRAPPATFTRSRRPEQLYDAWPAVTAENEQALNRGFWRAMMLGLHPFDVRDDSRVLDHAGATFASSAVVTLQSVGRAPAEPSLVWV